MIIKALVIAVLVILPLSCGPGIAAHSKHHIHRRTKIKYNDVDINNNQQEIQYVYVSRGKGERTLVPVTPGITENLPTHKASSDSINEAQQYIGMGGNSDRNDLMNLFSNAFPQKIDPARLPWCAAFANAVLARLGASQTHSLMAGSFASWGSKTDTPKQGDIVLLTNSRHHHKNSHGIDHVGFYIETVNIGGHDVIRVLGGNQSHQVKISNFSPYQVVEYRTAS